MHRIGEEDQRVRARKSREHRRQRAHHHADEALFELHEVAPVARRDRAQLDGRVRGDAIERAQQLARGRVRLQHHAGAIHHREPRRHHVREGARRRVLRSSSRRRRGHARSLRATQPRLHLDRARQRPRQRRDQRLLRDPERLAPRRAKKRRPDRAVLEGRPESEEPIHPARHHPLLVVARARQLSTRQQRVRVHHLVGGSAEHRRPVWILRVELLRVRPQRGRLHVERERHLDRPPQLVTQLHSRERRPEHIAELLPHRLPRLVPGRRVEKALGPTLRLPPHVETSLPNRCVSSSANPALSARLTSNEVDRESSSKRRARLEQACLPCSPGWIPA